MSTQATIKRVLRSLKRRLILAREEPNVGEAYIMRARAEHNAWRAWSEDHSHAERPMPPVTPLEALPPGEYAAVFPDEPVQGVRPLAMPDWAWQQFQVRDAPDGRIGPYGCARVRDATVFGDFGFVQLADGSLLGGIWQDPEIPLDYFWNGMSKLRISDPVRLCGTSAVITIPWLPNYYHFLLQLVPRIRLAVEAAGGTERIDNWIVPALTYPYERHLLAAAGLPEDKIKETKGWLIECDDLLVPQIPSVGGYVPGWASEYLRSLVLPDPDVPVREKVFIQRVDTKNRRILNEREVARALRARGYHPVSLDGLALREQAAVFHHAREIVGVHGAALSNLVHARPGARLVELLPANYVSLYFARMASLQGMEYAAVIGTEWRQPLEGYVQLQRADMVISVGELMSIIN